MMDIWDAETQMLVAKLVFGLVGTLLTWFLTGGHGWLDAKKQEALEKARESFGPALIDACEWAIGWVEVQAGRQIDGWTSEQKLEQAAGIVQKVFNKVDRSVILACIETTLTRAKAGWGRYDPPTPAPAASEPTDTPDSIAARAADTAAEVAEAKIAQLRADVQEAKETAAKAVDTLQSLARSFGLRDGDA